MKLQVNEETYMLLNFDIFHLNQSCTTYRYTSNAQGVIPAHTLDVLPIS